MKEAREVIRKAVGETIVQDMDPGESTHHILYELDAAGYVVVPERRIKDMEFGNDFLRQDRAKVEAERDALRADIAGYAYNIDQFKAENAALRSALEKIANCKYDVPHSPAAFINALAEEGTKDEAIGYLHKEWNVRTYLQHIARTALAGEGEK